MDPGGGGFVDRSAFARFYDANYNPALLRLEQADRVRVAVQICLVAYPNPSLFQINTIQSWLDLGF